MIQLMTREAYLKARKEWKDEYADISINIRVLKKAEKEAARGGWTAMQRLMSLRARMSNEASSMMDDLDVLKENSRLSVQFDRFLETQNFS